MDLAIKPVTPELWPALEDLFGKAGASNGCWCMYWRIGPAYRERERARNKAALRLVVKRGPPPGLLALDGDIAVGWCQVTPREDLPWLDERRELVRVDGERVWSISCFYVRRGYRGKGVSGALVEAAMRTAKRAGAQWLEAYPYDGHRPSPQGAYTGLASTFRRAGFEEVARRKADRPIMRKAL